MLSLFKIPKTVCKEFIKIQLDSLWGWGYDRRKITWVSWKIVCKSRDSGGLGIKDIECFNVALLGKWKWRLGMEGKGLWSEIKKILNMGCGDHQIGKTTIIESLDGGRI